MGILESDFELYNQLKGKLVRQTAISAVISTLIANLLQGTEDTTISLSGH